MIADAFAALVAGDSRIATSAERVAGGVRLRTPDLPDVHDYNALLLEPGAGADAVARAVADDPALDRVIAFAPSGRVAPEGWTSEELVAMGHDGPRPGWPEGVTAVEPGRLGEARREALRSSGIGDEGELAQLTALQDRQVAVGRLYACLLDGRPLGWAQAVAGVIEDVYVDPAARRRGLGRALTQAAVADGGRWLLVDGDNVPALALYRSLGFAEIGTVVQLQRGG